MYYTYKGTNDSAINFVSGGQTTFNVSVSSTAISINSVTIEDWNTYGSELNISPSI